VTTGNETFVLDTSAILALWNNKDPEFEALSDRVALKTLPYKKTK